MSLASRAGDVYYSFRFVKMLTTPFNETEAYDLGIIDEKGKRTNKPVSSGEEKTAYTVFHRLVFNIKKLLERLPGGKNKISSYAAAFFLLKEQFDLSDKTIEKLLAKMDLDSTDFMAEDVKWYLLDDKQLSPGVYKLHSEKVDNSYFRDIALINDKILVKESCHPVGSLFGLDIYQVEHVNSKLPIYVTLGEIYK